MKTKFEVKKETEKAVLILIDGDEVWLPKSWINDDGSLNDKALKKIEESKKTKKIPLSFLIEEREKVLVFECNLVGEIAPEGGFVSSMVRSFRKKCKLFIPKFAIKKRDEVFVEISLDFFYKKIDEMADFFKPLNGQWLSCEISFN